MAFDYASLIRAGAGLLFGLVGILLLVRTPRTRPLLALGIVYVAFAASGTYVNLIALVRGLGTTFRPFDLFVMIVGSLLTAGAGAYLLRHVFVRLPTASKRILRVLVAVSLVCVVVAFFAHSATRRLFADYALLRALGIANGWAAYFSAIARSLLWIALIEGLRSRSRPENRTWLLALFPLMLTVTGMSVASVNSLSRDFAQPPIDGFGVVGYAFNFLFLIPMFWGLRLAGGPHGRLARNLQAALWAYTLLALVQEASIFGVRTTEDLPWWYYTAGAALGVARILALLTVVWAIFYGDLLPRPLQAPSIRRGTLAAATLMALFVTAQVAQNFLGAKYGVFAGGIVAGIVVFAASPLQRFAESHLRPHRNDDVFRRAARLALADRILTGGEERDLLILAGRLGLSNERAFAILDEQRPTSGR